MLSLKSLIKINNKNIFLLKSSASHQNICSSIIVFVKSCITDVYIGKYLIYRALSYRYNINTLLIKILNV